MGETVTCCLCGKPYTKPTWWRLGGVTPATGTDRWWCVDVRTCRARRAVACG